MVDPQTAQRDDRQAYRSRSASLLLPVRSGRVRLGRGHARIQATAALRPSSGTIVREVAIAAWLTVPVVVLLIGLVIGAVYRPHEPFAMGTLRALVVTAGVLGLTSLLVGYAITPDAECGNTGCDTSYGLGAILLTGICFIAMLPGAVLGRLVVRHRGSPD